MDSTNFSILNRPDQLKKIASDKFDLVIIGGGVTGAGIVLDAASRGLKTCLIEKNDFASGTSNKSTKLIHGGLRYLKQLEIGLVKESGRERAIVHKLAPHLVIPEKMLLPLVKNGTYGKMMTSIGLRVYDFLADVEGDDRRKMLNRERTLKKEPLLDKDKILGSGYYSEYRTDDARLTIELLKRASVYGATILNYCEMKHFVYDQKDKIKHIVCMDNTTNKTIEISSKSYVSAAGPWVDLLREKDNSKNHKYLHLSKGVHIVFPFEKFPLQQSVYFDVSDGRMVFAIPRGRSTYVGTTDTSYYGDLDRVVSTKDDANYLINAVNSAFPDINLKLEDVESSWAGLRPLIHEAEKDPSELSRKDEIFVSNSGLISIAGGKLTGYRKMAHRVIDAVFKAMSKSDKVNLKDSFTEKISLTSDALESYKAVKLYKKDLQNRLKGIFENHKYIAWYLTSNYGKQSDIILKQMPTYKDENPELRLIRAELWYGIHNEMINSISDFFVRRTGRLYFDINSVIQFRKTVLNDCINYFNWNSKRIEKEKATLAMLIKDATHFYKDEIIN